MDDDKDWTVARVSAAFGVSDITLKKWEKQGLITVGKQYSKKYKRKVRVYSPENIQRIKWLKKVGGSYQTNEFYLKLLLEYIETGKIAPERLHWPVK